MPYEVLSLPQALTTTLTATVTTSSENHHQQPNHHESPPTFISEITRRINSEAGQLIAQQSRQQRQELGLIVSTPITAGPDRHINQFKANNNNNNTSSRIGPNADPDPQQSETKKRKTHRVQCRFLNFHTPARQSERKKPKRSVLCTFLNFHTPASRETGDDPPENSNKPQSLTPPATPTLTTTAIATENHHQQPNYQESQATFISEFLRRNNSEAAQLNAQQQQQGLGTTTTTTTSARSGDGHQSQPQKDMDDELTVFDEDTVVSDELQSLPPPMPTLTATVTTSTENNHQRANHESALNSQIRAISSTETTTTTTTSAGSGDGHQSELQQKMDEELNIKDACPETLGHEKRMEFQSMLKELYSSKIYEKQKKMDLLEFINNNNIDLNKLIIKQKPGKLYFMLSRIKSEIKKSRSKKKTEYKEDVIKMLKKLKSFDVYRKSTNMPYIDKRRLPRS